MSIVSPFLDTVVMPRAPGKVSKRVVQFEPGPGANYDGPAQAVKMTKKKMPDGRTFSTTVPIYTLQDGHIPFVAEAKIKKAKPVELKPTRIVIADAGKEIDPKFPEYYYNEGIRPSRRKITLQDLDLPAPMLYRP